nr:hypothetical protein [Eubacterium sp.]
MKMITRLTAIFLSMALVLSTSVISKQTESKAATTTYTVWLGGGEKYMDPNTSYSGLPILLFPGDEIKTDYHDTVEDLTSAGATFQGADKGFWMGFKITSGNESDFTTETRTETVTYHTKDGEDKTETMTGITKLTATDGILLISSPKVVYSEDSTKCVQSYNADGNALVAKNMYSWTVIETDRVDPSYKINYDLGGGEFAGEDPNPTKLDFTKDRSTHTLVAPLRLGYRLSRWTSDNTIFYFSGNELVQSPLLAGLAYWDPMKQAVAGLNLTAEWGESIIKISFDPAGGELEGSTEVAVPYGYDNLHVSQLNDKSILANIVPTKEG